MIRLLQTSDVHLGARHPRLGDRAADQRERQFAAFERTVELAIASKVDLFLVAGDLFDRPVASKASVDRVAAALRRLVEAGIRSVILPGDHDGPGRTSLYRAHDLAALAGAKAGDGSIVVLGGAVPDVAIPALGAWVTTGFPAIEAPQDGWRIGLLHRPDRPREDEIAAAGVDHLAIGGPHRPEIGHAGSVSWGASGAPELVDDEDAVSGTAFEPGAVLLVTLDEAAERPAVERLVVGRTRAERLVIDLGTAADEAAVSAAIANMADPDLILDVRLRGSWPDALDLDPGRVEAGLVDRFLRLSLTDEAVPELTPEPLPPADTIGGALIRDLEARIAAAEAEATDPGVEPGPALELRHALRLGRRLLAGQGLER